MKKILSILLAVGVIFAFVSCSDGGGGGGGGKKSFTITYDANGYVGPGVPSTTTIAKNGELTEAHLPTLITTDSSKFEGWSYDALGTEEAKVNDSVVKSITLYVKNSANTQPAASVRFVYDDQSVFDFAVTLGDDTWGDLKGKTEADGETLVLKRQRDVKIDQTKGFKAWADATDTEWTDDTMVITQQMKMKATWWDNTYVDTAGAEKIALENTTTAVYGFTLPPGKTLQDIKGITYSFQLSEYDYKESSSGNLRIWGPYFYNSNPVVNKTGDWNDGTVMYGDFALDRNGVYIAKFNGSGATTAADILTYNKFHPYYHNANVGGFGPDSGGNAWATKTAAEPFFPDGLASIQPKTWIKIDLSFDKFSGATSYAGADGILARVLETRGKVWPKDTDMNTVYFSVGLYGAVSGGSLGDIGYARKNHFTQLVKDVKLVFKDDTFVNGAAPSFGKAFAGYTPSGVVYSYRGPADQPIAFPQNPTDANSLSCICAAGATTDCGKTNCSNKLTFCKDVGCDVAGKTATTIGDLKCTRGCSDCAICTAAGQAAWECTCATCIADRAQTSGSVCVCTKDNCTSQAGGDCGECPACYDPNCPYCGVDLDANPANCECVLLTGNLAAPFTRAGNPVVVIRKDGLYVDATPSGNWAGIDFKLAAPAALAEGDVIKITASSLGTAGTNPPEVFLQVQQNGDWAVQLLANGPMDTELVVTLDATLLGKITSSGFSGAFRIRFNNNPTPIKMLITSFTVTRPDDDGGDDETLFDLATWMTANK